MVRACLCKCVHGCLPSWRTELADGISSDTPPPYTHEKKDELDVFGPPLKARRTRDDDGELEEGEEGKGGKKRARVTTTGTAAAVAGGGGDVKPPKKAPERGVSTTVYEGGDFDAEGLAAAYAAAAEEEGGHGGPGPADACAGGCD